MSENIIDKQNEAKLNFLKANAEKTLYLDEFKENVILALTEKQVLSGVVYQRVIEEMKKAETARMKMRRDVPLKAFKPYIMAAEKAGLQYTLVDALDTRGNIALVMVAKEAFEDPNRNIVLEDLEEKFEKAGLSSEYIKKIGSKLCKKHYELLSKKMPSYEEKYEKLTILDRILGKECPICRKEREND